jgi:hypothetical protein
MYFYTVYYNMKPVLNLFQILNNSKLFAGVIMIILNIGSKYISLNFTKTQEAFLKNFVAREVLVFAVCWMGTRDIMAALILTALFVLVADYLLHEESKYCVLGQKYRDELLALIDTNGDNKISDYEMNRAVRILGQNKNFY